MTEDQDNVSDRKGLRARRERQRRDELTRKRVIEAILSLAEGREWLWWVLSECGVFRTPFSVKDSVTSFNCGRQDIGHMILADVMLSPDRYLQMAEEAKRGFNHGKRSDPRAKPDADAGSKPAAATAEYDPVGDE